MGLTNMESARRCHSGFNIGAWANSLIHDDDISALQDLALWRFKHLIGLASLGT